MFACTRNRKYTYLLELVRRTYILSLLGPPGGLLNDKFYCLFGRAAQNPVRQGRAECMSIGECADGLLSDCI